MQLYWLIQVGWMSVQFACMFKWVSEQASQGECETTTAEKCMVIATHLCTHLHALLLWNKKSSTINTYYRITHCNPWKVVFVWPDSWQVHADGKLQIHGGFVAKTKASLTQQASLTRGAAAAAPAGATGIAIPAWGFSVARAEVKTQEELENVLDWIITRYQSDTDV